MFQIVYCSVPLFYRSPGLSYCVDLGKLKTGNSTVVGL
ncbi:hypothetical protein LDG_8866 [Legionella drancourtii LLAP12]|uniref:Uncharacterized protein n=1 Tax=Legionella drancourtii LLAP12 TaxID=658187 RepID=G9EU74_9GAMM|nr:hypothetical protein LDG_8866 [Legionella drancourtii LLAP12]